MIKLNKISSWLALSLVCASATVAAHDLVPGKKQAQPILLKNGTVHTVTDGTLSAADVLLVDGKIAAVGQVGDLPANTQVIDISGQHVYPGLIAMDSTLGLTEISAVRATRDMQEVGEANPDVKSRVAFNADSELIPTVRANGITHVQVVPSGQMLAGLSSLLQLDAWNWTDAVVKGDEGVNLVWPRAGINTAWWEKRSPEKQREQAAEKLKKVEQYFTSARAYYDAYQADSKIPVDSRWHAMMPVFAKEKPLYIHADDRRQIEQAVKFAQEQDVRLTIIGGQDAWQVTELLNQHKVGLVYERPFDLPRREDEAVDQAYKTPKLLADAKVRFALTIPGDWGSRSLPFAVGQAMNYGLPADVALASVTIEPAKLLGVDGQMGSITVGKNANLVVSKGDLFDYTSHGVTHMYIDGREVNLDNRHKRLYHKYQQKAD